jgi:hypothetical protein
MDAAPRALAEPDTIVIAESTRRLVGNLLQYLPARCRTDRTRRPVSTPGIVIEPVLFYPRFLG